MADELATLGPQSPDWLQVSDAGVDGANGLYKRADGWHFSDEAIVEGFGNESHEEADDSDDDQYKLLVSHAGEYGGKPYPFALMCWQSGKYTLLFEPWGLPAPGGTAVKARRFVIFADALGVPGYEPYYQAFQICEQWGPDDADEHRRDWMWTVGPAGIYPPPCVKPFTWQGGYTP